MSDYKILVESSSGDLVPLDLFSGTKVQYNITLGGINTLSKRETPHSNTYKIRITQKNLDTLQLNLYNHTSLASRMNRKYKYKGITNEGIVSEGFLIVGKILKDGINILLVDNALSLIDKWGDTTMRDFYTNLGLSVDTYYQDALDDLRSYTIPTITVKMGVVANVQFKNHPIVSFPNTLNTLGSDFNMNKGKESVQNEDGDYVDVDIVERYNNALNTFQTRPLWNVKALFDLACQQYGYSPSYSTNADTSLMEEEYVVGDGGLSNDIAESEPQVRAVSHLITEYASSGGNDRTDYTATHDSWLIPDDYGYVEPDIPIGHHPLDPSSYTSTPCIMPLIMTGGGVGLVTFGFTDRMYAPNTKTYVGVIAVWKHATTPNTCVTKQLVTDPVYYNTDTGDGEALMTFDKEDINIEPVGAGQFLGVILRVIIDDNLYQTGTLYPSVLKESFIAESGIAYDSNKQYTTSTVNLLTEAPKIPLIKVISGLLTRYGLKLQINHRTKVARFFTYQDILDKKTAGTINDWTEYFLSWKDRDTNYGDNFAKINHIGLSSPFKGNTHSKILPNQGDDSKYKSEIESFVPDLKDVEGVIRVNTATSTTPSSYYEFENKGIGLVSINGTVSGLKQAKVDNLTTTALDPIPYANYVDYKVLPIGVSSWYELVGTKLKKVGIFKVPPHIIKNLDLETPIRVREYTGGGDFIINKVLGYQDGNTPVDIEVIQI